MPSFSTIKVLLAAAFWRAVADGELREARPYAFQPWQSVGGAGVLRGFRHAAQLTLADYLHLALVVSDNDATNVVIAFVGFDRVNALAAELGLADTALRRQMMDWEAAAAGRDNVTCARDLAALLEMLVQGDPRIGAAACENVRCVARPPGAPRRPAPRPAGRRDLRRQARRRSTRGPLLPRLRRDHDARGRDARAGRAHRRRGGLRRRGRRGSPALRRADRLERPFPPRSRRGDVRRGDVRRDDVRRDDGRRDDGRRDKPTARTTPLGCDGRRDAARVRRPARRPDRARRGRVSRSPST